MTRWIRWAGLAVVLAAAAVLSFDALRGLALAVSIPPALAWLLPLAVDAGAAVSCACWLSRGLPADAVRFARWMTWLLLGGTVVGNAAQLGMHASGLAPPWWVAVAVGAIPPAVVGGTVHLAVLVGRTATLNSELTVAPLSPAGADVPPSVPAGLPAPVALHLAPTPPLADLVAAGAGRATVARTLGVTEHEARRLLAQHRAPA